jgi:hypothetical protein
MNREMTTPERITVRIPTASGDELEAWVYRAAGDGSHPAIVMAHGFAAVKAGGLAFAERFRDKGSPQSCSTTGNGAARAASLATRCPSRASARTTGQ